MIPGIQQALAFSSFCLGLWPGGCGSGLEVGKARNCVVPAAAGSQAGHGASLGSRRWYPGQDADLELGKARSLSGAAENARHLMHPKNEVCCDSCLLCPAGCGSQ